jgi:Tfp pilus assembly protein PilN
VSQVNLLPPDILQRQERRRLAFIVAAGGGAVIVLILLFYLLQAGRLSSVNGDIAARNRSNAGIQTQIDQLKQFATLQTEAQQKQKLLGSAFANEASFSGLLQDVSRVIPSDAYLTSLSAQISAPATGSATTSTTQFVGSMIAAGQAGSVQTLSSWLTRLESVRGWENPWVTSITQAPPAYTFSSGVDLSKDVLTARGRKGAA